MARLMHISSDQAIADYEAGRTRVPVGLCGSKQRGAGRNAPMCPTCARLAGWTSDRR